MDKTLITERFGACLPTYHTEASVQKQICRTLADLIPVRTFDHILEIGCGTGFLTRMLLEKYTAKNWYINDLVPVANKWIDPLKESYPDASIHFFAGDAESLEFPKNQELIISASTIQWFEDLQGFFKKAAQNLTKGGLLAFSTFGPENMIEIKTSSGIGLEYPSLDALKNYIPNDFKITTLKEEKIILEFTNAREVLNHIRKTGVNGISREKWTRSKFLDFCMKYEENYTVGDKVTLTYHPVFMVCEKE
ncbi:MAG: malonyl-ACP O-methyltransferase BioC [Bacteroidales bacterium]|nr:malonyl-ACP O-methyltransferase BioC [Bacteroidales bacterium]